MKKLTLLLTVTLGLALAAPAWAGDYVKRKDKTIEKTKVSGNAGTAVKEITDLDQAAMTSISVTETSDVPTQIKFNFKWLPGKTDADKSSPGEETVQYPNGPKIGTSAFKGTGFSKNPELFIRGVKVCQNKKNNRIKGIKIYSAKVDAAGKVTKGNPEDEFKRPNCNDWKNGVFCPDNKVAVGAIGHYSDKGFVGLALRCQAVELIRSRPRK